MNNDIIEQKYLDSIDWNRISEQQAATIGVLLGNLNHDFEVYDRTLAVIWSRASLLVLTCLIVFAGPWISIDTGNSAMLLIGIQLVGLCYLSYKLITANSNVLRSKAELNTLNNLGIAQNNEI